MELFEYCPCKSGDKLIDCCGKIIDGLTVASTPQELMRSRYTAFVLANVKYLYKSMTEDLQNKFNQDEVRAWTQNIKWVGLVVFDEVISGKDGEVEFEAVYKEDGKVNSIHEHSTFINRDGFWLYSGRTANKFPYLGRNSSCPCASGKKFKKCCYVESENVS